MDGSGLSVPSDTSLSSKVTMVIHGFGQSLRWRQLAGITRSTTIIIFAGACLSAPMEFGLACDFPQTDQTHQSEASDTKIRALVKQLGSDDFQLRELAESELLKIGRAAIEPVRRGRGSENSEIRFRAERLLPLLRRAETESRFQEFIDTGVAEPPENFTYWQEFSQIVGAEKAARELYAAIHKASPQLFENLRSDPNLARLAYFRLIGALNRARFRSLNAAAVLFLDTIDFDNRPNYSGARDVTSPQRIWTSTETLIRTGDYLSRQNAISFIQTSGFENQFRSLTRNWIECLPAEDNHLLATKLSIIESHRLIDQLPAMLDMASNENHSIQSRAKAIAIIAKLGGPSEVGKLQDLLRTENTVGHFASKREQKKLLEVQLRDVALAACIYLSRQDPEDFGFMVNPHRKNNFMSLSRAGFFSQAEREEALKKWQQYYQENLRMDE